MHSSLPLVSSPLAVVADIAARLAAPDSLDERLTQSLMLLRDALGATSCTVWQHDAAGMVRRAFAGEDDATARLTPASFEQQDVESGSGAFVRRLIAHQRHLGALVVRAPNMPVEAQLLASTIARLLAAELARNEELNRLRVEIDDQALRLENERRFTEKIIDSLPVGLYVIDREYRVQAWNRKRETGMQGVSREEALGRTIFEMLHRQPAELLRREFDECLRTGRLQQYTLESRGDRRGAHVPHHQDPDAPWRRRNHPRHHDRRRHHRLARGTRPLCANGEARGHRPARRRRHARDQQPARDDCRLRREPLFATRRFACGRHRDRAPVHGVFVDHRQ